VATLREVSIEPRLQVWDVERGRGRASVRRLCSRMLRYDLVTILVSSEDQP